MAESQNFENLWEDSQAIRGSQENFPQYISRIGHPRAWMDWLSMRAAAQVMQINIVVFKYKGQKKGRKE